MQTVNDDLTPEQKIANSLINLNQALFGRFGNDVETRREILARATPVITEYYLKGQ